MSSSEPSFIDPDILSTSTEHSSTDPDILTMAQELEALRLSEAAEDTRQDTLSDDEDIDDVEDVDDDFASWDDFNQNLPALTTPKCGGLFLTEDNKVIPFVGTDPDAKVNVWTYDSVKAKYIISKKDIVEGYSHQKGPVWNGQFCPTSLKDTKKVEETCKEFKGTKFDGLAGKDGGAPPLLLTTYKEIICRHLIKNGMWDVFQYQLPKSKKMICLIENMGKVKLSEIRKHITSIKASADKYALQNLSWSGTYLLNSISNVMAKKVLQKDSITDAGPEILMAIVASFGTFTFDSMEKLKSSIKNIKLSSYAGENSVSMNLEIRAVCDRLWGAGYWDKYLLHYIASKYLQCSDEVFCIWAISHISKKTTAYLNATNNFHEDEIEEFTVVTYTQLVEDIAHKYEEMIESGMWGPKIPSKKQQDEPDLSVTGLQAAVEKAVYTSL